MKYRVLSILFAVAMLAMLMVPAFAEDSDAGYTYTVTVSSGLHGTEPDQTLTFNYGESWNPSSYSATPDDDKYFFRGWHVSGQETLIVGAYPIEQDEIIVASYGVKGLLKEYTVTYKDTEGNELYPTQKGYANAGDKIIIHYVYLEGYTVNAYNETKTISADESENVFPFVYTLNEAPSPTPAPTTAPAATTTTTTTTSPAAQGTEGTTPAETATGDTETPDAAAPAAGNTDATEAGTPEAGTTDATVPENADTPAGSEPGGGEATDNIGDNETPTAGPVELEDLDDAAVPQAEFNADSAAEDTASNADDATSSGGGVSAGRIAGIAVSGVAAVAVLGGIYGMIFRRRKR